MPGAFNADSIRLINPEHVEGDLHVENFSRTRWIPSQLEALKKQADELEEKINGLNAKKNSLEQTLEMLNDLTPEKANPEELLAYIKNSQVLRLETENELVTLKAQISREQAALKAVELTAPFRPLPGDFKGQSIDIQFTFDYRVFGGTRY